MFCVCYCIAASHLNQTNKNKNKTKKKQRKKQRKEKKREEKKRNKQLYIVMGRSTHTCPGNANFYGRFWFKILSSMITETIIAVKKQLNQEIPQK